MCLENIGRIAFPEYLASFLDNILRQVPAVTVPVHTHLWTPLALLYVCSSTATLTAWIKRMTRPHKGQAVSPRRSLSSCLLTRQQRKDILRSGLFYAQLQMRHQMLRYSKISDWPGGAISVDSPEFAVQRPYC